jgi:hypothetical protein
MKLKWMGGRLSSGSCRGCGVISLVSHLSFSTPLQQEWYKSWELGNYGESSRGILDFTFSIFMGRLCQRKVNKNVKKINK